MDKLNELLKNTPEENLEVELKFHLNFTEWLHYFETLKSDIISTTKSIAIIYNGFRKEIFFDKNNKKEKEVVIQKKLIGTIFINDCKVSISQEIPSTFDIDKAEIIRIKLRASFIKQEFKDWRWDFTITKKLDSSDFSSLNKYKDIFLQ